jgi:hypothetical protein
MGALRRAKAGEHLRVIAYQCGRFLGNLRLCRAGST